MKQNWLSKGQMMTLRCPFQAGQEGEKERVNKARQGDRILGVEPS